ncbi:MAG: methionyl-tRNA formyltransferase [Candidatus Zixiibacteriota bacterium]
MKIVFFGTGAFGLPTLQRICGSGDFSVSAIVTGPDQPQGRGRKLSPSAIAAWAESESIGPILKPVSVRDPDLPDRLRSLNADLFLVVAYRILPEAIYTIPPVAINLHASLLPRYRGAAPIQRAIMAGETRTGVTTFVLQKTVDTGGILLQRELAIAPEENAGELSRRLALIGAEVVVETLRGVRDGTLKPQAQDASLASPAPKILPADRVIDFAVPADAIVDRVRGLAPKPAAVTMFREKLIKILALRNTNQASDASPGTIVAADARAGLKISAGGNILDVVRVQPEGRSEQTGPEFVRGQRIKPGERFERAAL